MPAHPRVPFFELLDMMRRRGHGRGRILGRMALIRSWPIFDSTAAATLYLAPAAESATAGVAGCGRALLWQQLRTVHCRLHLRVSSDSEPHRSRPSPHHAAPAITTIGLAVTASIS